METVSISRLVDELVISVHRAVIERHGDALRPIISRWEVSMPGVLIDLAEFELAGALTPEIAADRFPFLPGDVVADALRAAAQIDGLHDDLRMLLDKRSDAAVAMWGDAAAAIPAAAFGTMEALAAATSSFAAAFRSLPLPEPSELRLHHLLTGLRYERLAVHVRACDEAPLGRADAVALSEAWSGASIDDPPESLMERGLVDADGRISGAGRTLRDTIEAATDRACAPMWDAVTDLDGWLRGLASLNGRAEPDQSSRPASS